LNGKKLFLEDEDLRYRRSDKVDLPNSENGFLSHRLEYVYIFVWILFGRIYCELFWGKALKPIFVSYYSYQAKFTVLMSIFREIKFKFLGMQIQWSLGSNRTGFLILNHFLHDVQGCCRGWQGSNHRTSLLKCHKVEEPLKIKLF